MNPATQRQAFDLPADVCYLNAAFMGPLPRAAITAAADAAAAKAQPWTISISQFFEGPEAIRRRVADLIGAQADTIALTPSVSYGTSIAARNIPVQPGQTILVLAREFPSNILIWRRKAEVSGARVHIVDRPPGASWTEAVLNAIADQVALAALPQTHWIDGGSLDLPLIAKRLRAVGAALALDLTQSLGVQPFDVGEVQPDFIAAAGYKWMLGPYTLAYLYAAPHWHEGEPIEEGWANRDGAQDFSKLSECSEVFSPGARRFDMGERAHFHALPLATPGLDLLATRGPAQIAAQLADHCAALAAGCQAAGLTPTPAADRAPHYLTAALPADAPADLVDRLAKAGVYVSRRGDRLRITPHVYTTESDIDRFRTALCAALRS